MIVICLRITKVNLMKICKINWDKYCCNLYGRKLKMLFIKSFKRALKFDLFLVIFVLIFCYFLLTLGNLHLINLVHCFFSIVHHFNCTFLFKTPIASLLKARILELGLEHLIRSNKCMEINLFILFYFSFDCLSDYFEGNVHNR